MNSDMEESRIEMSGKIKRVRIKKKSFLGEHSGSEGQYVAPVYPDNHRILFSDGKEENFLEQNLEFRISSKD